MHSPVSGDISISHWSLELILMPHLVIFTFIYHTFLPYLFIGGTNFRYGENSQVVRSRWGEKNIISSNVGGVSKYATFRKSMKNYHGGNKSHFVTLKTPTNHSSSRQDIVFWYVENYVGIGYVFRSCRTVRNCISHLKLRRNHDLNPFALTIISPWRLCLRPPDPITVGKLKVSAFSMCY